MKKPLRKSSASHSAVPALARAISILEELKRSSIGLSKTEISRKLGIPFSSTYNLLVTLEEHGYVRHDPETKNYSVGYRLLSFGSFPGGQDSDLRAVASPVMKRLVEETQCTVHLAVLDKGEAIYIDKLELNRFFRINSWIGKRNYPHTSAVGKALVAYLPAKEIQEIWKKGLPKRTSRTVRSLRAYQQMLREVVARQYAIDDEEEEIGGRCVAAPIFNASGSVVAAIGVSAHISYLPPEKLPAFGGATRAAATEISRRLGYTDVARDRAATT